MFNVGSTQSRSALGIERFPVCVATAISCASVEVITSTPVCMLPTMSTVWVPVPTHITSRGRVWSDAPVRTATAGAVMYEATV